jgi:aspartyl-tRNA(Asn)/glutamyl-tRNA(Gln) amidotransferase subunit A
MTDFTQATAAELSSLYQAGAASPVTVTEQVLAKIEQLNPALNAFCFTDPDTTLAQAQASAERWRQGQPLGTLDGIPVAVKDSILTKHWPTLHASRTVDQNQSWSEDARIVNQLREAGCVFMGKTTMSEFSITESNSDSLIYGSVKNPWNVNTSPGGSSGGSAVAVATGMTVLALATDCGGSIAVPSAWCGTVGYKPSHGCTVTDIEDVLQLGTTGFMARSVKDIQQVFTFAMANDEYSTSSSNNSKIAVVNCLNPPQYGKLINWLADIQCVTDNIELPLDDAAQIFDKLIQPQMLHKWLSLSDSKKALTGKKVQQSALLGHHKEQTYEYMVQRQKLQNYVSRLMQDYDFIIGPAVDFPSYNMPENIRCSSLSILFALTKQPTITIPIGLDQHNMPVGVMIAGKKNHDRDLIDFAQHLCENFAMPVCSL